MPSNPLQAPTVTNFPTNQESSAIRRGNETNRLEQNCTDNRITAIVNGQQVYSGLSLVYRAGRAGRAIRGRYWPDTDARPDNLVVTQR